MKLNLIFVSGLLMANAGAAPFQNLGFEQVNTNAIAWDRAPIFAPPRGNGPAADLLPGWELFRGSERVSTIGYNLAPIGFVDGLVSLQPQGGLSADLTSHSLFFMTVELEQFYLKQRGDVPADAQFLTFRMGTTQQTPFFASINGVDLVQLNNAYPSFSPIYQADVSPYAGQNVELVIRTGFGGPSSVASIESIAFVVPEPSAYALLALGLGVLGVRWVWRHARQTRRT